MKLHRYYGSSIKNIFSIYMTIFFGGGGIWVGMIQCTLHNHRKMSILLKGGECYILQVTYSHAWSVHTCRWRLSKQDIVPIDRERFSQHQGQIINPTYPRPQTGWPQKPADKKAWEHLGTPHSLCICTTNNGHYHNRWQDEPVKSHHPTRGSDRAEVTSQTQTTKILKLSPQECIHAGTHWQTDRVVWQRLHIVLLHWSYGPLH